MSGLLESIKTNNELEHLYETADLELSSFLKTGFPIDYDKVLSLIPTDYHKVKWMYGPAAYQYFTVDDIDSTSLISLLAQRTVLKDDIEYIPSLLFWAKARNITIKKGSIEVYSPDCTESNKIKVDGFTIKVNPTALSDNLIVIDMVGNKSLFPVSEYGASVADFVSEQQMVSFRFNNIDKEYSND